VRTLRELKAGLGAVSCSKDEAANRAVVRKGLYLRRAVAADAVIEIADILPLRPLLDGIPAGDLRAAAGQPAVRDLRAGQLLRWSDLRR
jgi:sialic acid synthase SpsE